MTKEKAKKRIIIVCSKCGTEVTCSPGTAEYGLSGKGVCAREGCGGSFKPKDDER